MSESSGAFKEYGKITFDATSIYDQQFPKITHDITSWYQLKTCSLDVLEKSLDL